MNVYENVPARVFDLLPKLSKEFGADKKLLVGKENGVWRPYTVQEVQNLSDTVSYGLLKLGIQKGDRVAFVSRNCPEWHILDFAIQQIGAIGVPLYPTISEEDYKYNLILSESKYLFIYGKDIYRKIERILTDIPTLQGVYSFREVDADNVKLWDEVIELGKQNVDIERLEAARKQVEPSDIATIIYTSGTTGGQKGVMLTHDNFITDMECLDAWFKADANTKLLSYLPLSHIFEREVCYSFMNLGAVIYYAESLGAIVDNIGEIKPNVFASIPRLIEKIHYKVITKGQKMKGLSKSIFFWALNLGYRYDDSGNNSIFYKIQQKIADLLVYSKLRKVLGDELDVIIVGGAAIQPRLARLFTAMGIPICEGYGLTETSPVISVNSLVTGKVKIGTVGQPIQNVEVKISEEGEILARGPIIMKGYYKDPELTAEAIEADGWFHTGDKGLIDEDGFLKITGRVKEMFKTSMGKYVSPAAVENKLLESPFFSTIMVIGEGQKFAAALIVPNFEHLRSWCKIKGITYTTDAEMVKEKVIVDRMRKEVDKYNKSLGDYERVMKFELIAADWGIDTGEMTGTMKLKRSAIAEKYKDIIDKIYGNS